MTSRDPAREDLPELGVGLVGYAFMGAAHSHAWRTAGRFFNLPMSVRMRALCGRSRERVAAAASRLGWSSYETDWKQLLARDDIQLVDVCTPGGSHAEIAIAALAAGKHVICEKPLANTVAEARAMASAARSAAGRGIRSMVGFNYRRLPAATFARDLVAAGKLGTIRHVRAHYLQDWIVDPEFPLVWRLRAEEAGSGALGDIGTHIIDLTQFITGQHITGVSGLTETFVKDRPLPAESPGLSAAAGAAGRGLVTVDDAALFLARFDDGAVATFEATRFATGRKNGLQIEVNGDRGSLQFDVERLNELQYLDATEDPVMHGFRRIMVTEPSHPYAAAWWPPGHALGYEHSFIHQVKDLVEAVANGGDLAPSFEDGLQVQLVLDAVQRSAASRGEWTVVEGSGL
ncbi:MAG: Gfo/Idh/MocA family oxidoreductase [Nocardiopsaceae bacterium]|jgi:predicted dehydrogenase|nr:Gfo/Idh/MocA family oxidoreductase [Nocardiopsaceae bacterium]